MKSKIEELRRRGYLGDAEHTGFENLNYDELSVKLASKTAVDRTAAARELSLRHYLPALPAIISALAAEKALYTKIGLCAVLESFAPDSVKPLARMLGRIGNNQHKNVPEERFNKKSFPLPRDIAARTLARIGIPALNELIQILDSGEPRGISEAVDAIGFICFYNPVNIHYTVLSSRYEKFSGSDLIKWKIIRALSAFPEAVDFLNNVAAREGNPGLLLECERSLKIIASKQRK